MFWRAAAAGLPLLATDLGGTAAIVIKSKSMKAVANAHCLKTAFTGGGQHHTKNSENWQQVVGTGKRGVKVTESVLG